VNDGQLKQYQKNPTLLITAVRIDLDTKGLFYIKWNGHQCGKQGDWLVSDGADTYTIDAGRFALTYREKAPGRYFQIGSVWARVATEKGSMCTKEGVSEVNIGDYMVYNVKGEQDGYVITAETFGAMYVEVT
jgi:hypothetical protein